MVTLVANQAGSVVPGGDKKVRGVVSALSHPKELFATVKEEAAVRIVAIEQTSIDLGSLADVAARAKRDVWLSQPLG